MGRAARSTAAVAALAALAAPGGCALALSWDQYGTAPPGADAAPVDGSGDGASRDGISGGSGSGSSSGESGSSSGSSGCAGTCAPPVPSGWTGPVLLYAGNTYLPCAMSPDVYVGHDGLAAQPAPCSPCGCQPATGQSCGQPCVQQFSDFACLVKLGGCVDLAGTCAQTSPQMQAIKVILGDPTGGACIATGGSPGMPPPPSWAITAVACHAAPSTGTCSAAGEMCLATPQKPYEPSYCVLAPGAVPCPAGYANGHTFYGGVTDTRGCTACTCGSPTGGSCTAAANNAVDFYGMFGCMGPVTAVPIPAGCTQMMAQPSYTPPFMPQISVKTPGSCAASGGTPTGDVTPAQPTTVCCM